MEHDSPLASDDFGGGDGFGTIAGAVFGRLDAGGLFERASAKPPPLNEWAKLHRWIATGSRIGRWNPYNAPFSEEPMAAFSTREVATITIVSPTQLMKSEFAVNCAVYAASTGSDCLFYEPDINLLRKFVADRVRPALVHLGDLQVYDQSEELLKRKDTMVELRVSGGGTILGLTPQMRSGKSAHTAPIVILDELDLMGAMDMLQVARARTTTYGKDATIVAVSVPTDDSPGTIWRRWSEGSQGIWRARCVECGGLSAISWASVQMDKTDEGFWLPETAAMNCTECGSVWDEGQRLRSVRSGCYVHQHPDRPDRSYWIPGPAHIWRTVKDIAEVGASAWRGAQEEGDWGTYQRWVNEWRGEPWDQGEVGLSARRMLTSVYDLGARGEDTLGVLDPRVLMITLGADVQMDSIHAEIIGWGLHDDGRVLAFGLRYLVVQAETEGENIEHASMWDRFSQELRRSVWRHPAGPRPVGIQRGLIDSRYRTPIVRAWLQDRYLDELRAAGRKPTAYGATLLPSAGKAFSGSNTGKRIDLEPGVSAQSKSKYKGKFLPAVVWLGTDALKNDVYDSLSADRRLPQGAEVANLWPNDKQGSGYTRQYFDELSAEVKVVKRTPKGALTTEWKFKKGAGRRNEALDARVYATGAAHIQAGGRNLADHLQALKIRAARAAAAAADNVLPFPPDPKGSD